MSHGPCNMSGNLGPKKAEIGFGLSEFSVLLVLISRTMS